VTRTIVYIDGFNLYYRLLKSTAHKWLNLEALCRAVLPAETHITAIHYYTARVSHKVDPQAPAKQKIYLNALETLPLVTVHLSEFMVTEKWAKLAQPPRFKPACALASGDLPIVARIVKTEEKGSDVNLAAHLVRDAFTNRFDEAAVLTNDSDLAEPLRIVTQEAKKPLTLISPVAKATDGLKRFATYVRHVGTRAGACQFPDTVTTANDQTITKPLDWFVPAP
jgi:uncharacterized LabA/DUF88 family protein